MSYRGGRYWIVYNGEIYNFLPLRRELEALGHGFRSQSDTEVLVAAYVQWGETCVERLRGMFAFAILDRGDDVSIRPTLCLARDRFGIKPLYYAMRDGVFVFASELKGLLASGLIARRVDRQAVWQYLALGSIPQPQTILAGVSALMPGHVMNVSLPLTVNTRRYWDIAENSARAFPEVKALSGDEARQTLRSMLEEATRYHLVSDVPVAAFLSGGIDSTAVVGLMSRASGHRIRTYSVGFESKSGQPDERDWARLAARCFDTDHNEVIVTGRTVADEYDNLVHAIDQPSLDGTNTYLVSRAAGASVKVALSGLGGDELFAGYPHFRALSGAARCDPHLERLGSTGRKRLLRTVPGRLLRNKQLLLLNPVDRYATLRSLGTDRERALMTTREFMPLANCIPLTDLYGQWLRPELDVVAQTSYVEVRGYLANTLLRDVDAVAMGNSLEVRPVLLDHVLAEFVFALPSALKLGHAENKPALVAAVRDLLPDAIVRRRKVGFELPLGEWLSGPLRERALSAFSSPIAAGMFAPEYRGRVARQLSALERPSIGVWANLMLIEWLAAHKLEL